MDLKDIRAIVELMKKNDLALFELEKEGFKLKLKKSGSEAPAILQAGYALPAAPAILQAAPAAPAPAPIAEAAPAPAPAATNTKDITSPMVGTFYASPSPEAGPFVKVGQTVSEDTVVCIIEAMKVMNEIKAEAKGTIVEILGENGKPVQYGQPLFRIKPA